MLLLRCDVLDCEVTVPVPLHSEGPPDGWTTIRTARQLTDTERAAAIKKMNAGPPPPPHMIGPYDLADVFVEEKLFRVCPGCSARYVPVMKPGSGEDTADFLHQHCVHSMGRRLRP